MFALSIALYFIFILIYDVLTYTSSYLTVYTLISTHYYYFCILANVSLVCVIDVACTLVFKLLKPSESDVLAHHFKQKKLDPKPTSQSQGFFESLDNNSSKIDEKVILMSKGSEDFKFKNEVISLSKIE